jgi:hypothetical protein
MKEQMNSQSDVEERSSHPAYSSEGEPGLYFVGLHFQYALSSDVLPGVGRDAEYIAKHIIAPRDEPNGRPTAHALAGARRTEAPDRART